MQKSIIEYVKKYSKKHDNNLKYDFMPDLLEIIEKPAHIGGKVIIWGVFALLVCAAIWASFSKIDVITTAIGTVNPIGSISNVQALESGVINEVCVTNGQLVKAGDVLVKEDSTETNIDINSIQSQIELLESENAIYQMVLDGTDISNVKLEDYKDEMRNDIDYVLRQEKYYLKSLEKITDEESIQTSKEQHNISVLGDMVDNEQKIDELKSSLDKANKNAENEIIKSDINGYVTNMSDGLLGSVVSGGTQLLSIVPENTEMEIQCYVSNSDISEIEIGKEAIIKLAAYPYSDYGTLKGKVTYISASAVSNEQVQNVYLVKVSVNNKNDKITLLPGLVSTVEFNSGKRSVMEYFTDPITGALKNSIREK